MTDIPFTYDDLKDILIERIGLTEDEVPRTLSTSFTDLGLDSLAIVELQLCLRQEHGVSIPDRDAHLLTTMAETIDYVNDRMFAAGMV